MKEKTLLRIAFICSLIGLGILYFSTEKIELNELSIEKIKATDLTLSNQLGEVTQGRTLEVVGRKVGLNLHASSQVIMRKS